MPNGDIAVYGDTVSNPGPCFGASAPCEGDAFLLRLNMVPLNATTLDYPGQYLGGTRADVAGGIAIGAGGLMHVVGRAARPDFQPITPSSAYQPAMVSGVDEGFMIRLFDPQDFGGFVSFSSASSSVAENAGSITLTVTRTGTEAGASVQYATSNGTASAGSDYTTTTGTLTFAVDQTSRTITIPILDDGISEPAQTFTVTLSNPAGDAFLRDPSVATVTIQDNDTSLPDAIFANRFENP